MRIKIGSKVSCRFFNTPAKHFYGDYFDGIVEEIYDNFPAEAQGFKLFKIKRLSDGMWFNLHRKEIKKILS